jgi:hypothetical protein
MYQNSDVRVDAYDATGQDKNMYYGQIQEIWELDFHSFKIRGHNNLRMTSTLISGQWLKI